MSLSTTTECDSTCRISRDFDILRKTELFSSTSPEILKLFAYLAKHRRYESGEPIIRQGEKAGSAYFTLKGEVEISTSHKGREVTLQYLKKNSFFGELALLAKFDWFFTARAVNATEVLIIDRESFKKIIEKYPEKKDKIIEKLIQLRISRFEQQNALMLDKFFHLQLDKESVEKSFLI